jgi:hypothetical protein
MTNQNNKHISKSFQKALRQLDRWRKNKNPVVTTVKEVRKLDGEDNPIFHRGPANELWGRPNRFSMK